MKILIAGNLSRLLAIAGLMIGLAGCGLSDGTTLPGAASPGEGAQANAATIPAGTWRLVSMREAGQAEVVIGQPGTFTADSGRMTFEPRSGLQSVHAGYTADDRSLSVGLMACTRAFCVATAPLDTTYTALVESARTWSASGDGRLELASDAGVLRFRR